MHHELERAAALLHASGGDKYFELASESVWRTPRSAPGRAVNRGEKY
jgi:hypothetical protein